MEMQTTGYVEVDEEGKTTALKAASISLADCLACSGCITSAESVLVSAQSTEKFVALLAERARTEAPLVVSLSPQAVASLAAHYGLTQRAATEKLCAFFAREFGAAAVLDETVGFEVAVAEVAADLVARLDAVRAAGPGAGARRGVLPLLASECPGWVCYAEKTHPETLGHISTARSAMAVVAAMAKAHFGRACVHASVQPCYDKKLEAARSDLRASEDSSADVDIVLAATEVVELAAARGVDVAALPSLPLADLLARCTAQPFAPAEAAAWARTDDGPAVPGTPTSCAGGYLENALRTACDHVYGAGALDSGRVRVTEVKGRNADLREYVVRKCDEAANTEGATERPLRFAFAYGFRNIQNVVRKIKTGACAYDFVEIMACPHACANGGGQVRAPKDTAPEVWLARVKALCDARTYVPPAPRAREILACYPGLELHTTYHNRKDAKPTSLTQIKW